MELRASSSKQLLQNEVKWKELTYQETIYTNYELSLCISPLKNEIIHWAKQETDILIIDKVS
jgi:hypothetical protein